MNQADSKTSKLSRFTRGIRRTLAVSWRELKAMLVARLPLKLTSLVLAILLWHAIAGTGTGPVNQREISVPVRALIPASGEFPFHVRISPPSIVIALTGNRSSLRKIRDSGLTVFVNVEGLRPGKEHRVEPLVYLPEGVRLARPLDYVVVTVTRPGKLGADSGDGEKDGSAGP